MTIRASIRALTLACALGSSSPAVAQEASCPGLSTAEVSRRVGSVPRFDFTGAMLLPFLALWQERSGYSVPALADHVVLFAARQRPLLVVVSRRSCVIGLFPASGPELWQALRRFVGPAI